MKRALIVDGQGGRVGRMLVEQIRLKKIPVLLTVIGTNSIATGTMLKAGAVEGATGENPIVFNASKVDYIIGPIGIAMANSLFGEVTPKMASAISSSDAFKLLIPMNRCNHHIVGVKDDSLGEYIKQTVDYLEKLVMESQII